MSRKVTPPPPPPPSPHYASSSSSSDRIGKKYGEKEYEEVYEHFNEYCKAVHQHQRTQELKGVGVVGVKNLVTLYWTEKFGNDPRLNMIIEQMKQARKHETHIWKSFLESEYGQKYKKWNLLTGVGCGLASLGMLRWRRWRVPRQPTAMPPSQSVGGYKFDPVPKFHGEFGHRHQQAEGKSTLRWALEWSFDVGLAGMIGAGSYFGNIYYYDLARPKPIITGEGGSIGGRWVSPDLPLVPGLSHRSEELCGPLTNEFRKFPKELWRSGANQGTENGRNKHLALYANSGWRGTKYSGIWGKKDGRLDGNTTGSDERGVYEREVLDSLQGFVINCERRARHEKKISKNLFLPEGTPVHIPFDGVRADEDLELDDIYLIDGEEEK